MCLAVTFQSNFKQLYRVRTAGIPGKLLEFEILFQGLEIGPLKDRVMFELTLLIIKIGGST